MTVETTIQWMYDHYPTLFTTRKECYNHLFCTIGNGYEWIRGQLIYCDGTENKKFTIAQEKEDYASGHPKAKQTEEYIKKQEDWLRGAEKIANYKWSWYPICEYSQIKNIPRNIKSDWAAAVEECKQMLKADGIEV